VAGDAEELRDLLQALICRVTIAALQHPHILSRDSEKPCQPRPGQVVESRQAREGVREVVGVVDQERTQ
jgi:hypothetical protein